MNNTLLFGNGINRATNPGISWENLMQESGCGELTAEVPLPIRAVVTSSQNGNMIGKRRLDTFKLFQQNIKDNIIGADLAPSDLHRALRSQNFDFFVTTNYDDCLERSCPGYTESFKNTGGYKYLLQKIGTVDNRPIFHAHGYQKWADTLCISFQQYMGLISRLSQSLGLEKEKYSDSISQIKELVKGNIPSKNNWAELFFVTNVHILGLGLSFFEYDLWWLLSLRSSLFSPYNNLSEYENRIYYYDLDVCGGPSNEDLSKRAVLEKLGVEVVTERLETEDYNAGYVRLINIIKNNIQI